MDWLNFGFGAGVVVAAFVAFAALTAVRGWVRKVNNGLDTVRSEWVGNHALREKNQQALNQLYALEGRVRTLEKGPQP